MELQQVEYVSDPEFFKDENCEYPPCNEPGHGFARGAILCAHHYLQALKLIKYEKERSLSEKQASE